MGAEDKVEQCTYFAVITRVEELLGDELTGGWKVIEVSLYLSSHLFLTLTILQMARRSARAYL